MTKKELNNCNEQIAHFLGWYRDDGQDFSGYKKEMWFNKNNTRVKDGGLDFHQSWNSLMPVVEKIEALKNSDDYEVDIFGNCCDIGGKIEEVGATKIEATYKAVVKFIKQYNATTLKNQQ